MKLTPIAPTKSDWRDIRGLLINGWTAHTFLAQREGDEVRWLIRGLSGSAATDRPILPAIPGFFPGFWTRFTVPSSSTTNVVITLEANGMVYAPAEYQTFSLSGHVSFFVPGVPMPIVQPGLPYFP